MFCCPALLILVCGSLAASQQKLWFASSTSSLGSGGRIRSLERNTLAGRSLAERALKRNYQAKRFNKGILVPTISRDVPTISPDVTFRILLPTYYCWFSYFSRCPRSLHKEITAESLGARSSLDIAKQAVLKALGGTYMTGYNNPEYKKTSSDALKIENSIIRMI